MGGAGAPVLEGDFAVGAEFGDDEVGNGLAGVEVEVGGRGGGGAGGIDGDVAGLGGAGDSDVEDDCGDATGGNTTSVEDRQGQRGASAEGGGSADVVPGVQEAGRVERVVGSGCGGGAGEYVAGDVGDEMGGAGAPVLEGDFAVGAEFGDDEVGNGLAGVEVEVGGRGGGGAGGIDGDVAGLGGAGDSDVEDDCGDATGGNTTSVEDRQGQRGASAEGGGSADVLPRVQQTEGIQRYERPRLTGSRHRLGRRCRCWGQFPCR
mgnify:CR=1 FL=1